MCTALAFAHLQQFIDNLVVAGKGPEPETMMQPGCQTLDGLWGPRVQGKGSDTRVEKIVHATVPSRPPCPSTLAIWMCWRSRTLMRWVHNGSEKWESLFKVCGPAHSAV